MQYKIEHLPKEKWQGYKIPMQYEANYFYDVEITSQVDIMAVTFVKKALDQPVQKISGHNSGNFPDRLYEDWWEGAQAYGIIKNDALLALIELWHEEWSGRLRITELWVDPALRRQGIASKLMELARIKAKELGCRAILLETQSANEKAIVFYLAQGFSFFGFDRSAYSNHDLARHEVRLELGLYL